MNPKLQAIIDQIRSNPEYKKNLQNALTNPEGSDTFEDALRSMNGVIADARNIIVNDKALDAIKDEFVPPMAEEDPFVRLEGDDLNDYMGLLYQGEDGKEAVDDFILDKKIQDGMDRGQQDWFNEAFTPHAMDYLTVDDISDPTQVAIKKYRDSEADKFFDKAIDQDTSKGVGRAAGLFQAYKELSDPAKRRNIPNAAPLEDVGDTTPAEDLAHYEEALKILQERKANRAKSLENARAQMAGAAWMYRKDPSMLAAIFSEKSAKDIAKAGKESQDKERADAAMEAYDRQKRIYQYALNNFEENTDPEQEKRLAQELELAKIDLLYKAKKAKMSDEYDSIVGVSSPKQEKLDRVKKFLKAANHESTKKFVKAYNAADDAQKANYRQLMDDHELAEEDVGLDVSKQEEADAKARTKKRTKTQEAFINKYKSKVISGGYLGLDAKQTQERADIEKEGKKLGITVTWTDNGKPVFK